MTFLLILNLFSSLPGKNEESCQASENTQPCRFIKLEKLESETMAMAALQ